jgi:hypothetical protein
MAELRKCPFCGGEGILKDRYIAGVANRKNYWVVAEEVNHEKSCGRKGQGNE